MSRFYQDTGNRVHPGDELASGGRSATFTGPKLKFDEGVMRDDLKKLSPEEFILKYLITQREYDLMKLGNEEKINDFAQEMKAKTEFFERGLATDAKQAESLKRDCIIEPFVAGDRYGRVIVDRDEPATPGGEKGRLLIPRALRKEKTLLPTTGHIIKAAVYDSKGTDLYGEFLGKRILFGQMSGTPICFKGYPTWNLLELSEILGWVTIEDAEAAEDEVPPIPLV